MFIGFRVYQCGSCRRTFTSPSSNCPYCGVRFGYTSNVDRLLPTWEEEETRHKIIPALMIVFLLLILAFLGYKIKGCAENQRNVNELISASKRGDIEQVKLALAKGVDVNARRLLNDSKYEKLWNGKYSEKNVAGATALMIAAKEGHFVIVRTLIDHGGEIDAKDEHDRTPLMLAAREGYLDIVRALLSAGASENAKSEDGETPLIFAVREGRIDIAKCLLSAGAEINARQESGPTSLIYAAENNHDEIVKICLEAGANVNVKGHSGFTPLMFAARNGNLDVVRMLIAAGADVNAETGGGLLFNTTALELAKSGEHVDVVRALEEAKWQIRNSKMSLMDKVGGTNDYGIPIVAILCIGVLFVWGLISIIKDIRNRVRS